MTKEFKERNGMEIYFFLLRSDVRLTEKNLRKGLQYCNGEKLKERETTFFKTHFVYSF